MSFAPYNFFSKKLLKGSHREKKFALFFSNRLMSYYNFEMKYYVTYILICILKNLRKRAENTEGTKINHIAFKNDSLCFVFVKGKDGQEGDYRGSWHVYKNSLQPHAYPFSRFGSIHIFLSGNVFKGIKIISWKK